MTLWRLRLSAACMFLLMAATVGPLGRAQDYIYATGSPNFGVRYPVPGGFINITNGNVHLTIPLGKFKQRGKLSPVEVNLEYDSRIWQIVENGGSYSWQPTNVPDSNAGWRLATGLETGATSGPIIIANQSEMFCNGRDVYYTSSYTYTKYAWTDGQGTKHVFDLAINSPAQPPCGPYLGPGSGNGSGYATDSSGYWLSVTNFNNMTIYDRNGNEAYPSHVDPDGNTATLTSDSIGRTLVSTTPVGNTTTYCVLKEGGGCNNYTVTTESIGVSTSFGESAVSEYGGTLTAIESIELPDGSSYAFTYDSAYGELTSMTLPTGGVVAFNYGDFFDSYQNDNRWITSESDGGGTTYFAPSVLTQCSSGGVGCQEQVNLTKPDGNLRVYALTLNDGAWDGQTDIYQGNSSKTVTIVNNYNFTAYQCPMPSICNGAEYITASSSKVTLDDTNQTAEADYAYSTAQYGNLSSIKEFDYGNSPSGTPNRETDYTYGYSVHGAPFVTQKSVSFNGNPYSLTSYNYDSGGLGNLMSVVRGLSGQTQITTSYAYDSYGMKSSETDPNTYTTSYSYGCSDLYLSTTSYPSTNGISHTTHVNPDCSSGLPISTTDENQQISNYGYDSLGRKASVGYPDGGAIGWQYPSSTQVVETKAISPGVSQVTTTTLDSWGRKSTVSVSDPVSADTVTTTYDTDNRVSCVTNPERSSQSSTDGETCFGYDELDRPTSVSHSDGTSIQVQYTGNQATVTDENGNQKRYTYDAFHDLTSVFEPNASGSLSWETDYTWDAGGHLLTATQKGDGSSGARVRTFGYDGLGRLTQEVTPEAGTKTYAYDNDGNVQTVTTARGTITYNYDALDRVISETGGSLSNYYTYDVANVAGFQSQFPIGRMVEASNNVNASEQFSYDSMGRVVNEANCIPGSCSQTGNAVQAQYDWAGDVTSLTYPDGRVITQSYDSARHLTGVQYASWNGQSQNSPYFGSTTYEPTGQLSAATYGSGVQLSAEFNSRTSLTSLAYLKSGSTLWSNQYTWARNGKNLLLAADGVSGVTRQFTYDPANRLIAAEDLSSNPTYATATLTISGSEQSTTYNPCAGNQYPAPTYCPQTVYDGGSQSVTVNGVSIGQMSWGSASTSADLAASLASAINGNSSSPVTAYSSGSSVVLTSKAVGAVGNYSISLSTESWNSSYFSSPSFSISGPASLSGGEGSGTPVPGGLNETYSVDPWGNMDQSGNFTFGSGFTANNQIVATNGFSYDGAGDLLSDGVNNYAYNIDGTIGTIDGSSYVYDAQQQRVQANINGTTMDTVYFQGRPLAMWNPSNGAWTDIVWAGSNMIAEVAGSESATPSYRLLDHLDSLVANTDNSGNVTGTIDYAPYGLVMSSNDSDAYRYTGLLGVPEGYHAWYRDIATAPGRWLGPDPYNGSYDLMNPQSLNRYSYVNDNPLGFTDPSGLVDGWANGLGGGPCSSLAHIKIPLPGATSINPCAPLASLLSIGIYYGIDAFDGLVNAGAIDATVIPLSSKLLKEITPWVGFGISFACDFDSGSNACGQKSWTSVFIGGNAGKVVNTSISAAGAVFATMCAASGGWACPASIGYAIYTGLNDLFGLLWGLSQPQFHGTLAPRGADESGLGTSPIGIPNQNLGVNDLLHTSSGNPAAPYGLDPSGFSQLGPNR